MKVTGVGSKAWLITYLLLWLPTCFFLVLMMVAFDPEYEKFCSVGVGQTEKECLRWRYPNAGLFGVTIGLIFTLFGSLPLIGLCLAIATWRYQLASAIRESTVVRLGRTLCHKCRPQKRDRSAQEGAQKC